MLDAKDLGKKVWWSALSVAFVIVYMACVSAAGVAANISYGILGSKGLG